MSEARRRKRAGRPVRLRNKAQGFFGSNPQGTGVLRRHSLLPSLCRRPVCTTSGASIGDACHPFAFENIASTGPSVMLMARVAALSLFATMSPAHAADAPLSLAETLRLAVAESPDL